MTQGSDLKYSEGFQESQVLSNLAASTELSFISLMVLFLSPINFQYL